MAAIAVLRSRRVQICVTGPVDRKRARSCYAIRKRLGRALPLDGSGLRRRRKGFGVDFGRGDSPLRSGAAERLDRRGEGPALGLGALGNMEFRVVARS